MVSHAKLIKNILSGGNVSIKIIIFAQYYQPSFRNNGRGRCPSHIAIMIRMEEKAKEDFRLTSGRPVDEECIPAELAVYDFLDSLGIVYRTLKHPAAFSIEECNKVRERVNAPVFKNLFLTNKQQTRFYLLVMPGEKVFKTKYLSAQIGSARLSFANEEYMKKYLGVAPGSVSPLGLINDREQTVNVLLDEDLRQYPVFACHPCINDASVIMTLEDLTERVLPATLHTFSWVRLPAES